MARKRFRWKYRRCPACGVVRTASEFPRIKPRRVGSGGFGEVRRTHCPACGHEAELRAFVEVEPPEGPGGPNRAQPGGNR